MDPRDEITDEFFIHQVQNYWMGDADFADAIGVSRLTIERWRRGKNLPHQAIRRPILIWMEQHR